MLFTLASALLPILAAAGVTALPTEPVERDDAMNFGAPNGGCVISAVAFPSSGTWLQNRFYQVCRQDQPENPWGEDIKNVQWLVFGDLRDAGDGKVVAHDVWDARGHGE